MKALKIILITILVLCTCALIACAVWGLMEPTTFKDFIHNLFWWHYGLEFPLKFW